MADPYAAIVKKYGRAAQVATIPQATDTSPALPPGDLPRPEIVPVVAAAPPRAPVPKSADPYANIVTKYATQKRQAALAASTGKADAAIEESMNPGIVKSITDVAKAVPAAASEITTNAVMHPLQTGQSIVLGLMDVGPAILNTIASVAHGAGNAIRRATGQPEMPALKLLPLPGETFNDYLGRSDALRSVTEGAKQVGAYELGGAGVTKLTGGPATSLLGRAGQSAAGFAAGGQVVAPPTLTFKERAQQAAFDAAFGAIQTVGGSVVGKLARDAKAPVEVPKVEVPGELPPPPGGSSSAPKIGRSIPKVKAPESPIPDVVFARKANLGVDTTGEKVLATTEYSTKTGKAIVYYSKELDQNPQLRQTVLDHEIGHVLDKRANSGRNLSAELQNPTGNEATLRNVIGPFARETKQTVQEAATKLATDIETLSQGHGSSPAEKFANAYAAYRQDPIAARKTSPTFDSFMQHRPVPKQPVIDTNVVTAKTLKPKGRTYPEPISARTAKKEQSQSGEKPVEPTRALEKKINPTPQTPESAAKPPARFYRGAAQGQTIKGSFKEGKAIFVTESRKNAVGYAKSRGGEVGTTSAFKYPYEPKIERRYAHEVVAEIKKIHPEILKTKAWKDDVSGAMEAANTDAIALQELGRVFPKEMSDAIRSMGLDGVYTRGAHGTREYVLANPELPFKGKPLKVYAAGRKLMEAQRAKGEPVVIDPDALKKQFNDYNPKNHELYSTVAKRLYTQALKEDTSGTVIFTGGGSGSGKSELLIPRIKDEGFLGVVYDTTLSNYDSLIEKIRQAAAAGKKVEFTVILPRIESAWKFVQKRAIETGRMVPLDEFIKAHMGFVDTVKRLVKEGYNVRLNDTREIFSQTEARNNGFTTDSGQILAKLDELKYNKSALEAQLKYVKYSETVKESAAGTDTARKIGNRKPEGVRSKDGQAQPPSEITKGSEANRGSPQKLGTGRVRTAPPKYTADAKPGTGRIASTGLRTGKGVSTKSFNPSKIDAPSDVQELFNSLGADSKNFASQRLSKGNEDIKDLARLTGLTEKELIAARPGSIANAETTTAARQLVLNKAQNLMDTLKGIDVSTASPTQLKAIRDDFVKLVSMQKAVAGFRTEASNVFRSLGLELAPGENATLSELAALLKQEGLASEGDAAIFSSKVAKQMILTKFERVREGVLSTWYAAILSGPKTTVRNILSTSSNILTEIAAKAANPRQWKEVMPAISGLLRGLKMGLSEARAVLRGAHDVGKFMETGRNVTQPEIFTGKAATYGTIVESVGRFLNAQDKLMSAGVREMERASLKARGLQVSKAVEDAVTKAYAERTVYHGKPTGAVIGALRSAAQSLRRALPESKFIVPFVDTVANVMDRQFDYIPITAALRLRTKVVSEQASRIIKDYGLKEGDRAFIEQRIRDQQVGRLALGTIVSSGAILLAADGRVSGNGPSNYSEKQQLMRTGWRPNSIKIGDVWVPYTYLGPLAGIFSMAGNVYDKVRYDNAPNKDIVSLIGNGLVGWTQTQLNQSFLSGVADLFDVATGGVTPKAYLDRFISGLVPIPAAYSQTKDMIFRQTYQTHGIVDKIRVKLGLTEGMQPKLDQFGEPMTADFIFGISPSLENATKVDRFLISNDLVVSIPSSGTQYSVPGAGKEKRALTPEEYTAYVKNSGKQIYQELDRRLEELSSLSADRQKSTVQAIVDRIRTQVRGQVMRGTLQ